MQFVRQSKFRHVFCKPMKHEFFIQDVKITKISWDAIFSAVNTKFLAVITEGSGGPFMVLPLTKVGRVDKDQPLVDAHKGPCLDVAWCPFNENVIASCSEDTSVKIWLIPEGGLRRTLSEPLVELLGHQKRVSSVVWHPIANNVLLTAGGDLKILLWNVGTGEALIEIAGHPDLIWGVAFNYNGSKIVTTCKDKKIRVIDPRTGRILQQGLGHEGVKPQRALFVRDGRIFTTGFTKRSERMYALRDEEALDEPIVQEELDTSNGVLFPFYDNDSGLVYLCGKGDCNIRYYEVNDDPPFVHYINTYSTPEPQRGLAFMPKRGLTVQENEIARFYKCTNKGVVEILQFFVPRKSDLFQDDLYPDTAGPTPALSADDWIGGKDAEPILVPVIAAGDVRESKPQAKVTKKANILAELNPIQESAPARTTSTPKVSQPTTSHETTKASATVSSAKRDQPKAAKAPIVNTDPDIVILRKSPDEAPSHSYRRTERNRDSGRDHVEPAVGRISEMGGHSLRSRMDAYEETRSKDISGYTKESSGRTSPVMREFPKGESTAQPQNALAILEELYHDMQRVKSVVKNQDRRIRFLEMQLADKESQEISGL